ncbi:conserved domain protein [Anaerococcus hydrogenalis ACS-025-V-Sch4]|uniref:Conserved domain protein n=2 Tax=Anaerococcus hydrogenalis TaxID=33029 RepID=F0H1Q2_9FIRM|nr:conserved domain protein [Anaerococcus hydrogenalis ACS-025-V-Sch4]
MVTADELEWPIAVGRTIEELARDSGKSEMAIYFKMRNQKLGRRQTGYKVEVVEVEK